MALDLGLKCGKGGVLFLFFSFFFSCFGDTRINNTIFDFGWQFLLSGGVWVEGGAGSQVRVDEQRGMKDVGLGSEVKVRPAWDSSRTGSSLPQACSLFKL